MIQIFRKFQSSSVYECVCYKLLLYSLTPLILLQIIILIHTVVCDIGSVPFALKTIESIFRVAHDFDLL